MFRGLINDAKSAAVSLVAKYLARASVAVPFLIAGGFAIAAIAHMVIDRFGAIAGCWLLAAGFTLIGIVATLLVKHKEHGEEAADKADTANVAGAAAAQAALQAPLALAGALMSTPLGPKAAIDVAKTLLRNLPLVVLLALIALLFWPSEEGAASPADERGQAPPSPDANGAYQPKGEGLEEERAA